MGTTGQVNDKEWDECKTLIFGVVDVEHFAVGVCEPKMACVTGKAGRARLLIWAWTTTFCSYS